MNTTIGKKYFGNKAFYRKVFFIAFPIIIQTLMTNLVGLLDNVMVGRLGTDQMTGVSVVNQLFFVFYLLVFGGMSAAGIFSVQYFGQENHEGVRNTFRIKILFGLFTILLVTFIFLTMNHTLIHSFLHEGSQSGNINATFDYAKSYLFIILIGIPPIVISNAYSTTLKEGGETFIPMVASVSSVIIDLVFNYLLIFGKFGFPELGVSGAAIATGMSRYVEFFIVVIYTHMHKKKFPFIHRAYRSFKVPVSLVRNIVLKGSPILANEFLWSLGLTFQAQALSTRGLAAIGAININNTISNVFNIVFVTMGTTIAIIIGQLLGAEKLEEARDANRKLSVLSVLIAISTSIVLAILAPFFPHIYNTTGEIRHLASQFILVFALVTPFNAYTNAAYFTLRSGGKTIVTFLFDSCFIWVVNVPLSMILCHYTSLPIVTIFLIVNCSEACKAFIGGALIRKGIWMNTIIQ
ncbi:MAG: MATE family efflux transporter [Eubacterium sp.]|nr:MATE family efflux transporter [Eubacterium sp.]